MKTTTILTKHGCFTILVAAKGPPGSTRADVQHALEMAMSRIERDERRFAVLRSRRAKWANGFRVVQVDLGVFQIKTPDGTVRRTFSSMTKAQTALKKLMLESKR